MSRRVGGVSMTDQVPTSLQDNAQKLLPTGKVCQMIHESMQNMEKSLRCPLCLSCYHDGAEMISVCCHVYCGPCIRQALRNKQECPTCKQSCTRRSLTPAPQFDALVVAYKQMMKEFGLAPSRYDPTVPVTQIVPEDHSNNSESEEEQDDDHFTNNDYNNSMNMGLGGASTNQNHSATASRRQKQDLELDWMSVHERLQAARTFQKHIGVISTNNNLHKEQEAIVTVNERTLLQAAVRRQQRGRKQQQDGANGNNESSNEQEEQSSNVNNISLSQQNREQATADALLLSDEEDDEEEEERKPAAIEQLDNPNNNNNNNNNNVDRLGVDPATHRRSQEAPIALKAAASQSQSSGNSQLSFYSAKQSLDEDDDEEYDSFNAISKSTVPMTKESSDKENTANGKQRPYNKKKTLNKEVSFANVTTSRKTRSAEGLQIFAAHSKEVQQQREASNTQDSLISSGNQFPRGSTLDVPLNRAIVDERVSSNGKDNRTDTSAPDAIHRRPSDDNSSAKFVGHHNVQRNAVERHAAINQDPLPNDENARRPTEATETDNEDSQATEVEESQITVEAIPLDSQDSQALEIENSQSLVEAIATSEGFHATDKADVSRATDKANSQSVVEAAARAEDSLATDNGNSQSLVQAPPRADETQATDNGNSQSLVEAAPRAEDSRPREEVASDVFNIGSIVDVQSRTWPGVNKPGGVGRVMRVYKEKASVTYDISYVLGGKEARVDAIFVSARDRELGRSDKSGSVRLKQSIPQSLLEQLSAEGFDTSGASDFGSWKQRQSLETSNGPPPAQRRRSRKRKSEEPPEQASKPLPKKRRFKSNIARGIKRALSRKKKNDEQEVKPTPQLGNSTKCQTADELYEVKLQSAFKRGMLNVVGSGLSTDDLDRIARLRKKIKGPLKIRFCESLSKNTHVCLIAPHEKQEDSTNLVASSRTLKAMRAMTAGIPIVSTRWLESCLHAGTLLKPNAPLFIRTLPGKTGSNVTDWGVALQAAGIQLGSKPMPLKDSFIHLCGSFPRRLESDIAILAKEGGASILKQRKAVVAQATSNIGKLVLLCNDGSDASMSAALKTAVQEHPGNTIVVSTSWLFDSVSSVQFQDARSYPPEGTSSNDLWKLTTKEASGEDGFFGTTSL